MRNITVALDDDLARWVRVEAAKRDVSVSRFLGQMLEERRHGARQYEIARRDFESRGAYIHSGGKPYPTRDEIYDRAVLRRH